MQALHVICTPGTEKQEFMETHKHPCGVQNLGNLFALAKLLKLLLLPFLPYSKIILNILKYGFYSGYSNGILPLGLQQISHLQIQLYYVFVSHS